MRSIFLSYSRSDRDFVKRLATDLKRNHIDVWLDEWVIKPGDDIREEIEKGIDKYDFFGIVLSPFAVSSGWTRKELSAGMVKEISAGRTVILPVLLADCDIPLLLAGKRYADFRVDYQKGLAELLEVFRPLITLERLSQDRLIESKDAIRGEPGVVLLTNGTTLVGIVAGLSKSRNSLGVDPIHSSPKSLEFPPSDLHTAWVDIDPALIADIWGLDLNLNQELQTVTNNDLSDEDLERWKSEKGWSSWHFFDTLHKRLFAVAAKEHLPVAPTRDLTAMGERAYRYGSITGTSYAALYCDWRLFQAGSSAIRYREQMHALFKSTIASKNLSQAWQAMLANPNSLVMEGIAPTIGSSWNASLRYRTLDADEWVLIWYQLGQNGTATPVAIPVYFRTRGLIFAEEILRRISSPVTILGERLDERVEDSNGACDYAVKAYGAFIPDHSYDT